jgi:amidase
VSDDVLSLGAAEQARRIAAGVLSPVDLMRATLDRIAAANSGINAMVTLSDTAMDQARDLAAHLAAGHEVGPMAGVPIGIKDVTPVRGLRHTFGSPLYADYVASMDAVVVQRLRDAGGIIVGKTNTPEFAVGANTVNDVFGATRNPWDLSRSAGGSTGGGAAALATGMIGIAEGTDLGGSLRVPASFCGVVGLRPTPGLIPTWPSDYPWDTLQATGLMARRAEDLAVALQAVAGPSPLAPVGQYVDSRDFVETVATLPATGMRMAYCPDIAGIGIDAGVAAVCRAAADAFADAGASVEEVDFDLAYARDAFLDLRGHWMVAQHAGRLSRLPELGERLRGSIEAGLATDSRRLAIAEAVRGRVWSQFHALFSRYDFLLTPTMAVPPFAVDQDYPQMVAGKPMATYIDWVAPTFLVSLAGLPAASVPAGLDAAGLPVGLQIVGAPAAEGQVLAAAARLQELRPLPVLAGL